MRLWEIEVYPKSTHESSRLPKKAMNWSIPHRFTGPKYHVDCMSNSIAHDTLNQLCCLLNISCVQTNSVHKDQFFFDGKTHMFAGSMCFKPGWVWGVTDPDLNLVLKHDVSPSSRVSILSHGPSWIGWIPPSTGHLHVSARYWKTPPLEVPQFEVRVETTWATQKGSKLPSHRERDFGAIDDMDCYGGFLKLGYSKSSIYRWYFHVFSLVNHPVLIPPCMEIPICSPDFPDVQSCLVYCWEFLQVSEIDYWLVVWNIFYFPIYWE